MKLCYERIIIKNVILVISYLQSNASLTFIQYTLSYKLFKCYHANYLNIYIIITSKDKYQHTNDRYNNIPKYVKLYICISSIKTCEHTKYFKLFMNTPSILNNFNIPTMVVYQI